MRRGRNRNEATADAADGRTMGNSRQLWIFVTNDRGHIMTYKLKINAQIRAYSFQSVVRVLITELKPKRRKVKR